MNTALSNSLIFNKSLFVYGTATGIFFAAFLYMLFFGLSQLFWRHNRNVVSIFGYAALATLSFSLFHLYALPLHFPYVQQFIPNWVFFLGKISAPIGVYAFIKMFMQAAPIKTLKAFLFWHRTKSFYSTLFALCFLLSLIFLFMSDRKLVLAMVFSLFMLSCALGIKFAATALESKYLSKLYTFSLIVVMLVMAALIFIIIYIDLNTVPNVFFVFIHTLLAVIILLFSFVIMRYTLDETLHFESITKIKVEDFYKHIYQALEKDEFFVEYQPKIDLKTKQVCGMEALIRWLHPQRGLIPPNQFIPAIEKTQIIDHICQWLIKRTMQDAKALHAQGIHIPISINFSVNNIHPDMVSFLVKAVRKYKIPAHMVLVEITESLFLDMTDDQKTALTMIHEEGIKLSLDDFGAGFSSLRHLDEMGLSEVKIDRAFAEKLSEKKKNTVVAAVVSMCHALDIDVVAEGINDEDTRQAFIDIECDMAQGFGICRPKRLDDFLIWYRDYQAG